MELRLVVGAHMTALEHLRAQLEANRVLLDEAGTLLPDRATGNQALGAPNLVDDIWLHGAGDPDMRDVINNGRVNEMPAHKDLLSENRIRVLVAYVMRLSEGGLVVSSR